MLTSLSIQNYTLIERLQIDFQSGFSVITGETGAGKSMLLGALGLILGKRADLGSLKNKEEKCVIEASFAIAPYNLTEFFEALDLDYDPQTIIRREILPSGKSRAFVNDSPVTLQDLDELGMRLMDIHSQHQTRELSEEKYQFEVLDILAGCNDLVSEYQTNLKEYKSTKKALEKTQEQLDQQLKERDFDSFLLEELQAADLKVEEQIELEQELETLSNVEAIKEALAKFIFLADQDTTGIAAQISEAKHALNKISGVSSNYSDIYDRVSSLQIEFEDILSEVRSQSEAISEDPGQLQQITDRLQLLYNLQKKHRVASNQELITIQENLAQKVSSFDQLEQTIENLQKNLTQLEVKLDELALLLHQKREEAVVVFNDKVTSLLGELGMANAQFNIILTLGDRYFDNGKESLEFLFSANKGGQFGPLKKTASGGELSRIMLATKAVLAEYHRLPTIVFDEIDTGVSGEIAGKMAEIMQQMSSSRQVFSITHLPQIASKGARHYKVFKSVSQEDTVSDLKLLSNEERVLEIAEMLSGKNPSDSALAHARSLLSN